MIELPGLLAGALLAVSSSASSKSSSGTGGAPAIPAPPLLALGASVGGGVTAAEAVRAEGVVAVNAAAGTSVSVTFSDGTHTIKKSVAGNGADQAIALSAADLAQLNDGTITVSTNARDASGRTSATRYAVFTLDTHAPQDTQVSAVSAQENASIAGAGAVRVAAESGSTVVVTFSNGSQQISKTVTGTGLSQGVALLAGDLTNLGEGTVSVRAIATDSAGNAGDAVGTTFTLHPGSALSLPSAQVSSIETLSADSGAAGDFITNTSQQTIAGTFVGTLMQGDKIQISADGHHWVDASVRDNTFSAVVSLIANTTGTLLYSRAVDANGNARDGATHTYTVDTLAPGAPQISPASATEDATLATASAGAVTLLAEKGANVVVTFANGEHFVTERLTGTGLSQSVTLSASDLARLGNGAIQVQAYASDSAGNTSSVGSAGFTIDTTKAVALPSAQVTVVTGISADTGRVTNDFATGIASQTVSGTFKGTLAATDTIQVSADGQHWVVGTVSGQTFSAAGVTLVADTAGTVLSTRTVDAAGHVLPGASQAYLLDTHNPAPLTAVVTAGTGVVNLSGIESGASWQYEIDGGPWTQGTGHSFSLGPDTHMSFAVHQSDIAGNQGVDTLVSAPTLSSPLFGSTDFDAASKIVLTSSDPGGLRAGSGQIHIVNTGGPGFHGEDALNNQIINANDSSAVQIVGNHVVITPATHLDLANTYYIYTDQDAFVSATTGLRVAPLGNSSGAGQTGFSTVAPTEPGAASHSFDSSGTWGAGHDWIDLQALGGSVAQNVQKTFDASAGSDLGSGYAFAVTDHDPSRLIGTDDFWMRLGNFGADDLIYIDTLGRHESNSDLADVGSWQSPATVLSPSGSRLLDASMEFGASPGSTAGAGGEIDILFQAGSGNLVDGLDLHSTVHSHDGVLPGDLTLFGFAPPVIGS